MRITLFIKKVMGNGSELIILINKIMDNANAFET